ncbi:hypothetical protein CBS101457_002408 [Exobasidium rhododendri]|nr:hypothetical protein CBS101457_002408 [Exobasidium rhododendri]
MEMAQTLTDAKAEMIRLGYHGPSLWIQVICWGDHDQFQHVNNVHYLRFVESARIKFAEKAMAAQFSPERKNDLLKGTGEGFILHSVSMRYKRPVVYPDTLVVGTRPLSPLSRDRFTLQTGLYSISQKAIVTTSEHINVCYDYAKLTKILMPQDHKEALERVMGNVATP